MRQDLHSSGKCPALAGLLSGVQGKISAGGEHHQKMPQMRQDLHIPVKRPSLAKILPGMSEKAGRRANEQEAQRKKDIK